MAFSAPPVRLFSPIRNGDHDLHNRSPFRDVADFTEKYLDSKRQYKNVQSGGEVPLNGLNHPVVDSIGNVNLMH